MHNNKLLFHYGASIQDYLEFKEDTDRRTINFNLCLNGIQYFLGNIWYFHYGNWGEVGSKESVGDYHQYYPYDYLALPKLEYVFQNPLFPRDPMRRIHIQNSTWDFESRPKKVLEIVTKNYVSGAKWFTLCVGKFPLIKSN